MIAYLIEETIRQAANFPTVIVRDDWLMGVVAVQQVQLFLYQLFAESNKPMPPTGPKQWSLRLTPLQRQVLQSLPTAAPSPESVLAARDAAFTVFFRDAPPIAQRSNVPGPSPWSRASGHSWRSAACRCPADNVRRISPASLNYRALPSGPGSPGWPAAPPAI